MWPNIGGWANDEVASSGPRNVSGGSPPYRMCGTRPPGSWPASVDSSSVTARWS